MEKKITNNKKNKKKKSKKAKFDFKAFFEKNKKILIIALAAAVVVAGIIVGICSIVKYKRSQEINTGYFNIPEEVKQDITGIITKQYGDSKVLNFVDLTENDFITNKVQRKFDLVFAWDGEAVASIIDSAEKISSDCYANLSASENREEDKILPILLDHFEIAYNRDIINVLENGYPQDFMELQSYIEASKSYTFSPFFTNGGDDTILLGFISALVEGLYGYEAYHELEEAIIQKKKLSSVIDMELKSDGETEEIVTLRDTLDLLRSWVDKGLVHPAWPNAQFNDLKNFMEDEQVSLIFTTLSKHRTIPYKLISDFDADRMSMFSVKSDHALICPYIVGVKLRKAKGLDEVLKTITSNEVQGNLSKKTKLAPVASRSSQYDRQADDVRFLATACKYGPRTDIYNSAFQLNPEAGKKFADEIRNYLRFEYVEKEK